MLKIQKIDRKDFNIGIYDTEKKEFVQVCASESEAKRVLVQLQAKPKKKK